MVVQKYNNFKYDDQKNRNVDETFMIDFLQWQFTI